MSDDPDDEDVPLTQVEFDAMGEHLQRMYYLGQRDAYRHLARLTGIERWKANQDARRRAPTTDWERFAAAFGVSLTDRSTLPDGPPIPVEPGHEASR